MQKIYIPSNGVGIAEGYYTVHRGIVALLREHKHNSAAIQFIADMLE